MATKTYKTKDWATVRVTTNADGSRSATVVSSWNSGIASWTTVSWTAWGSATVSNNNYWWSSQTYSNVNDAINYAKTNYNNTTNQNQNINTTPQINLWEYWKFWQDAYNTPNFNIDKRNDLIIQGLWANATNEAAVRNYLMSNQSFANASPTDQQNTINSILRKAATVATANNPVVSVNWNENTIPFDMNDPQDYLDRLQARTALTWQQLTQDEYYNMLKAQRAIQQQQYKNPYEDYMKQLQQQIQEAQLRERQRDEQALQAYQSRLDSQYGDLINQQKLWWQASQQSAQNVYSFSGFGRSSAAANKQAEIQDSTNRAIQALNQQKLAEIELKRAELEWADGDELTYLKNQMDTLSQATTEWQLKSLSQMAEANAQAGNDAITSITNMLAAAANSWIDITWDGYERIITAFNGMTPEQQDAYLSTLNPTDQLLVLWWAANSADGSYKFISWSKYQKAWYFNEKTWEFFPLSWGGSYGWGSGWWNGGWNWGGGSVMLENWMTLSQSQQLIMQNLNKIKNAFESANGAQRLVLRWQIATWAWDIGAAWNNVLNQLAFEELAQRRKNGFTGTITDADMARLAKSSTTLSATSSVDAIITELNRIATNISGSPLWNITPVSTNNNTNTNTTTNTNTNTNTTSNWPSQALLDYLNK